MLDLSLTLTSTPICATAAVCRICRIGAGSVEVAVTGVDALLLLTEWQHYTVLNWMALAGPVHSPAWLFDASSVTDPEQVRAAGLTLWRIANVEG